MLESLTSALSSTWHHHPLLVTCVVCVVVVVILYRFLSNPLGKHTATNTQITRCKNNYTPDLVYLWLFPRPRRGIVDISPYALKVETFLRIANIPYECHHVKQNERSDKGQIPFLFLNGRQISDSSIMISALTRHFNIDLESGLSLESRASGHSLARMVDQATVWTYFYYRYVCENIRFWRCVDMPFNKYVIFFIAKMIARGMKKRSVEQGTGRLSEDEMWRVAFEDLRAISHYLGEKEFMLGDKPTTVDAVMFGHLAQIMYIDIPYPHRDFILTDLPNLERYVERVRGMYWPDWDDLIQVKPGGK